MSFFFFYIHVGLGSLAVIPKFNMCQKLLNVLKQSDGQ